VLSQIAEAFADIGDFAQAIELTQSIGNADYKSYALRDIAQTLASEPIRENRECKLGMPIKRRFKKEFTPEEQQLARQLVEAMQAK
ncbi:MAG: hypothetical protein ACKVT0_09305, partial [Planctomycetaceae bacterium]